MSTRVPDYTLYLVTGRELLPPGKAGAETFKFVVPAQSWLPGLLRVAN